jgi:plastocyanin domain-containing protein
MKPDVVNVEIPVTIVIKDGIYQPSEIRIPANKQVTLHFLRKDDSACAATVIFPQLKSSYDIPKNIVVAVILPPQPPGIIDFTCRMGMYRGKLVVA